MSVTKPEPPEPLQGKRPLTARVLRQKVWKPPNVQNDWSCFVIVGREGSGKSHTLLSILEKADPTFSADRAYFDPTEFLEFIKDLPEGERQGKAVMLDEAGVGLGVRSWYDEDQIKLNKLMQTARDDNMIVGLTLPRLKELDSQFRGRLHGFCEMQDLEAGQWAEFSWKNVVPYRDDRGGIRTPFPKMRVDGRKQRITRLKIGPPSDELAANYEDKKSQFKQELYEDTLSGMKDEDDDDSYSPTETAEEVLEDERVEEFVGEHPSNGMRYIDKDLLEMEFGLSHRDGKKAKKLIESEVDEL